MSLNFANISNRPHFYAGNNKNNNLKTISFKGQELNTPEVQEKMKAIDSEIQKADNIAVVTHSNPDGDAVGSSAALKNLIELKYPGKKVDVFLLGTLPNQIKELNDANSFEHINKNTDYKAIKARNYDLAISVDCANKRLMKDGSKIFKSAKKTIKIDHHPVENELKEISEANITDKAREKAIKTINYADINLVCDDASAASQVILLLAESMGIALNKEMASHVYHGLITDTQGFRYMKKPSDVFEDCSKLTKAGIDEKDSRKIYCSSMDYMPKAALKLYTEVLNNVHFSEDGKIAYIVDDSFAEKDDHGRWIKESKTFDRTGLKKSDVKAVFDKVMGIILNIEGVKIAAKISEKEDRTKGCTAMGASLRGNGVGVKELAKKHGGGGHEFAAAFIGAKMKAVDFVNGISEYLKSKEQQN